jgi:ABC-type transport system substrate-binding protein
VRWLAAAALVIACGEIDRAPAWRDPVAGEAPRRGGVLRTATKDALLTLDPRRANDELSIYVIHLIFDGLLGYAPASTTLVPRLAEALPELLDGGLRYRLRLRAGLRYGDGEPIRAADFKRALEAVLHDDQSSYRDVLATSIAGAKEAGDGPCEGIVAVDDRTLEIRLHEPSAAFVHVLAMPYAAPLSERQAALPDAERRRAPLASGPYELVEWDEGRRLELRRRPHYDDPERQYLDGIVVLENVTRDLQFMMFERGDLDLVERLAAPDALWLESQAAWRPYVKSRSLLNAYGSRMDTTVAPFADVRVRRALNYAVHKGHIEKLLAGTATASHGILPPGALGRDDTLPPYPYDPAKARALLAEAGYPDGFATTYYTFADDEASKLALSLQHDLAQVGVRVRLVVESQNTLYTDIGVRAGPTPFSWIGWIADSADPASLFDPFASSSIDDHHSTDNTFYSNPALDALLAAARAETDRDRRAALFRRADQILHDDAPWIWGYHQGITEVTQPYVHTVGPHPVWVHDYTGVWLGAKVPR